MRSHEVIATHPHDASAFTQGLLIANGRLFESTGLYGLSGLYEKELRSGRVLRAQRLPPTVFAEGLARVGDELVQISWREQLAFFYDLELRERRRQRYVGEGWGLTSIDTIGGERLLLSDGSAQIQVLDPSTLAVEARVTVRDGMRAITQLNELEMMGKELLANVWHSSRVAVIEPASGRVIAWLDFSDLLQRFDKPAHWVAAESVLNGLAYDPQSGHLFVTGKWWPVMFEVQLGACSKTPEAIGN